MEKKLAISMFGQKRLSREGGIEIVVKEWRRMDIRSLATTGQGIM